MSKAPYKTKQMAELLTFLESVQGKHVTVNEICDYFKEKGISVGTTTVYRHLEKMVKEGVVAKYVVDGTSSACFEYTGNCQTVEKECSYHCICEHMMEHHSFEMDSLRTVFYGICNECRNNKE